jgi:hypothetical protein
MTRALIILIAGGLFATGCAKHQFSELPSTQAPAAEVNNGGNLPEVPPSEPPPEPPPVVVTPEVGPSLVWVQVPVGTLATYEPVPATYNVIPGTSPLHSIECLVDKQPIACKLEGDTLTLTATVAGEHYLQVTVTDENNLQDSDTISWSLYDKFEKVKTPLVVAKEDAQADVLFVIDNSKSMRAEQANMADRISDFIERVKGLDWKIAIVTTDTVNKTNGDGRFLKFPNGAYSLTSALDDKTAKSYFGKTIQTGVNGDYLEQGIKTTYRAIERYISPKETLDQQNKNFFRKQAALSVIVISDENESGKTSKNQGPELLSLVQKTWGAKKLFKFHSIITRPGDTACLKKNLDRTEGFAYAELTALTGGVLGDICAADYGNQLTVIGQDVANTQNTYELSCSPKDINNDGIPDVRVYAVSNVTIPSFQINGKQIVFSSAPVAGSYSIEYFCPK